jgi:hypothetical protein
LSADETNGRNRKEHKRTFNKKTKKKKKEGKGGRKNNATIFMGTLKATWDGRVRRYE